MSAPLFVPVAIHSPVLSPPSHSLTHALAVGPGSAPLLLGGHAPLQGQSYRARGAQSIAVRGLFVSDIVGVTRGLYFVLVFNYVFLG